ncbi:33997_t:CDS:1, partial [Gigaspora margarita]
QLKPEYCTVNREHLCRTHLSKCKAFHETYSEEEMEKILALPVPEDKKKNEQKTEALT